MDQDQIKVYRKDTGEIVYVPEHWLDHPVLSQPFRKTPSEKAKDLEKQAQADAAAQAEALGQIQVADPSQPDATTAPSANTPKGA